jgi:uncharacterized protein YkwD
MSRTKRSDSIAQKIRRHAAMTVVPHHSNQFQPHIIRSYGIIAILVVATLLFTWSANQRAMVLGVEANVTSTELLTSTNEVRKHDGLPPLEYSDVLSNAAYLKAQDMLKKQYWAHTAPDGATPWVWFSEAGYSYAYAGENLARNFTTAKTTIDAWMASQKHRDNILGVHYTDVGFAVVDGSLEGRQTKLIVALYGQPASEITVAGASVRTNAPTGTIDPLTMFGITLQSLSPAALGAVALLMMTALVALIAHAYRRRMPLSLRRSWKYHHGLYKAVGLSAVAIVFIALYSGGQI